ncbi:photosystem II reaction center PsbP family protein [Striga asiatica]|uniref:Photosystem II reaction center PsbP family protein n=1 Tax=Striga asiatica TaxID=4170 RepID=A0A5A7QCE9_STRAF|nr:photosystem II reaction center PsbP family protein [Striga asiatica]
MPSSSPINISDKANGLGVSQSAEKGRKLTDIRNLGILHYKVEWGTNSKILRYVAKVALQDKKKSIKLLRPEDTSLEEEQFAVLNQLTYGTDDISKEQKL